MKLFDFSLLVGADPKTDAVGTRERLAAYLDREEAQGVVASLAGVHYDFLEGNPETLSLARADRRLIPALTVDPRRVDAGRIDFREAGESGFGALALFPLAQHWTLSHPALRPIMARADSAGMPVILHVSRAESSVALRGIAPGLGVPVIALGIAYSSLGDVVAGAGDTPNLLFGMSLFAGLYNVETLVERLGAERIVFDSGEPRFASAPALEVLRRAEIDETARQAIMVANAERIFGGFA